MASSLSDSPAKQTRFFKTITSDIGSHTELMIPTKFVNMHGNDLNDRIIFKVPSGSVWPVELERRSNEVWLAIDWPEFTNIYSIRIGYMLLFEYLGDSQFQVSIFDSSASEIDYSLNNIDDSTSTDVIRPCRMIRAGTARKANRNGESARKRAKVEHLPQ